MQPEQVTQILFLLVIVAVFWFLVIRPARNRQREAQALQSRIQVGSKVMLTSGIHGEIAGLSDETAEVTIAPGTTITVHRQAVMKTVDVAPATGPDVGVDEPTHDKE